MGKITKARRGTETSSFGTKGRVGHDSSKFYGSRLYDELTPATEIVGQDTEFPKEYLNKIVHGSCEKMQELPDRCLHLMVTSPPYNVSKDYDDDLSLTEYLGLLQSVFAETYRVLVDGGRACINVANLGRKPYLPLSDFISRMMMDIGFNMRGEIIWDKASTAGPSTAWGSWQSAGNPTLRDVHEYILVFSKGSYKRNKGVDTITRDQFMEWTRSVWNMGTESARRIGHPAPFPVELPYRLIHMYSFAGDVVLDPFMGSGTTAVAALRAGRAYFGYDTCAEYIALAEKRIGAEMSQVALF